MSFQNESEKCHAIRSNIDLWSIDNHTLLRIKKSSVELYCIIHQAV